jgi:hypothetical protein
VGHKRAGNAQAIKQQPSFPAVTISFTAIQPSGFQGAVSIVAAGGWRILDMSPIDERSRLDANEFVLAYEQHQ